MQGCLILRQPFFISGTDSRHRPSRTLDSTAPDYYRREMESPEERLLKLLRNLPAAEAQNRLMRISDRELAICMLYMDPPNRGRLLGLLGSAKRQRVSQETGYVSHLRLRYPQYRQVIEKVIGVLSGYERGSIRSYIRPVRGPFKDRS